ncbi:hypothetical protein E2C01_048101 [Portunus trituberculatus]|uniref:Uncharacterized protein n=1 Tax=Portunus trituberculatus TaxID=210409 RepID=A0A5B7GA95_PORTR|nr:hypothetical protein [Portunus trituberculatus]
MDKARKAICCDLVAWQIHKDATPHLLSSLMSHPHPASPSPSLPPHASPFSSLSPSHFSTL